MFDLDLGSTVHDIKFHEELYNVFVATREGISVVNIQNKQVDNTVNIKE